MDYETPVKLDPTMTPERIYRIVDQSLVEVGRELAKPNLLPESAAFAEGKQWAFEFIRELLT